MTEREQVTIDRRDLMKMTGGGAAAGLSGLAGCIGPFGGDDDDVEDPEEEAEITGVPEREILTATAEFDVLRPPIASRISDELEELGVSFPDTAIAYAENQDLVIQEDPEYDIWLVRITSTPDRIEPNFQTRNFFHSDSAYMRGWNWMHFSDPDVDFLCDMQQTEMDQERRREIVYRIQEQIHEKSPEIQVVHPQLLQVYNSDAVSYEGPFTPGEGILSFWARVNATPGSRSEIREAWTSPIDHLNPVAMQDALDMWWGNLIYSRLLRIGPDGTPQTYETEELEILSDTQMAVTLNDDLVWHDGQPVTVEDVKYSFDTYVREEAPFYSAALNQLEEVVIEDDQTVRFDLTEPNAPFIHSALAGVMLIQQDKWEQIEDEHGESLLTYNLEDPLGSGPFEFESFERGDQLRLVSNEDFVPEPPEIDALVRENFGNMELAVAAASEGDVDVVPYLVPPTLFEDAQDDDNLSTNAADTIGYYGFSFFCERRPFTHQPFRKAVQYAIPRQEIVDEVMDGFAEPGISTIAPGNEFWHNPDLEPYTHDLDKAREILSDAGYSWDEDGNLLYPPDMRGVPAGEDVAPPRPD